MMRAILKAYGDTERRVWVADSFQGLPRPNADLYPTDRGDDLYSFEALAVSQAQVEEHFRRFGLLDDQVRFLKGWFKDTLPTAPNQPARSHAAGWRHVRIDDGCAEGALSETVVGGILYH